MKKVSELTIDEVIHCSTREEAEAICKLLHEAGFKWNDGHTTYIEDTKYSSYRENTYYRPIRGTFGNIKIQPSVSLKIYKAKEFMEDKEQRIVGYKLKDEFKDSTSIKGAVLRLLEFDFTQFNTVEEDYLKRENWDRVKDTLEKTEVLNLWFEPIYGEEFKVGDIVVLTSNKNRVENFYSNNLEIPVGVPLKIKRCAEDCFGTSGKWIIFEGYNHGISSNQVRKATPVEIKRFNRPELPKINGYLGKDIGKYLSWGCFEIRKEDIRKLMELKLKSFTLEAADEVAKVSEKQFEQIKNYLNK